MSRNLTLNGFWRVAHHSRRRKVQHDFCCTWRRAEPVSEANGSPVLGVDWRLALAVDAWLGNLLRIAGVEVVNRSGEGRVSGEHLVRQDRMSPFRHAGRRGRGNALVRLANGVTCGEGPLSEVDAGGADEFHRRALVVPVIGFPDGFGGRRVAHWEGLAAWQECGDDGFAVEA